MPIDSRTRVPKHPKRLKLLLVVLLGAELADGQHDTLPTPEWQRLHPPHTGNVGNKRNGVGGGGREGTREAKGRRMGGAVLGWT